jgi:hypothetical protein
MLKFEKRQIAVEDAAAKPAVVSEKPGLPR